MDSVASKMNIAELKAFKNAFELKSQDVLPAKPQLNPLKKEFIKQQYNDFKM
jgi:hypothetical protein